MLCLLKTPLRWSGGVLVVIASVIAIRTPLPDVLVSTDGQVLAVRGADGRLSVHRTGRNAFAVKEWLAADGDARLPNDKALGEGFRCDPSGCIVSLAGGKLVSQVITPAAFEEDCRLGAVVVTRRELPGECKALVVDRKVPRGRGDCASLERRTLRASGRPVRPGTTGPGRAARSCRTRPLLPDQRSAARLQCREPRIWKRGTETRVPGLRCAASRCTASGTFVVSTV